MPRKKLASGWASGWAARKQIQTSIDGPFEINLLEIDTGVSITSFQTTLNNYNQSVYIAEVVIIVNILYGSFMGLSCLHTATRRPPEPIRRGVADPVHDAQTSGDYNCRSIRCY